MAKFTRVSVRLPAQDMTHCDHRVDGLYMTWCGVNGHFKTEVLEESTVFIHWLFNGAFSTA
jgi:hypothetical protein